jgi:hypothetical protein
MLLALVVTVLPATPLAAAFNYDRYQAADLEELLTRRRPKKGIDIYPVLPLRLTAKLAAYGEPCETGTLMKSLVMTGVFDSNVKITNCIQVRSSKGKLVRMFIQDTVAQFLPKEVALDSFVTLFVVHTFTSPDGPGLLVNEFKAMDGSGVPT